MLPKKILNIVPDDKFIDDVIKNQDVVNNDIYHEYVLVSDDEIKHYKYIKNEEKVRMVSTDSLIKFIKDSGCSALFLHSLPSCPLELIPLIPKSIKVFWFSWGGDIYQRPTQWNPAIKINLYHKKTKETIKNWKSYIKEIYYLASLLLRLVKFEKTDTQIYRAAVARIDYYSGVLPEEYELMRRLSYFNASPVKYMYNVMFPEMIYDLGKTYGDEILVGNSGDPTNNHKDIIELLRRLNLKNRIINIPLSYGGDANYINNVVNYGKSKLGKNQNAIKTYMGKMQYLNLLKKCSIVIFYHERQQALGNIYLLLMLGAKIFLSENSITYKSLEKKGFIIYSIQRDLNQYNIDHPLTEIERKNNIKLIQDFMSKANYNTMLNKLYALI